MMRNDVQREFYQVQSCDELRIYSDWITLWRKKLWQKVNYYLKGRNLILYIQN